LIDALGPRGGRPVLPAPAGSGQDDPGEPALIVAPDPDSLSRLAASHLIETIGAALAGRGRADVALTGGSTPGAMYRRLVEPGLGDRIAWDRVHLWWGDDRFVPRGDPLSNLSLADERLLAPGGIRIPTDNVHPFPTDRAFADGLGAGWCASTYASDVAAALPTVDGWPAFDLVLVGIGGDGHLLSVFPGSAALTSDRLGLAIPAPTHIEPRVDRVTLNPAILVAARAVLATATGGAKAGVIARILEGRRDPMALPGVLARRAGATWILDRAAAERLGPLTRTTTPPHDDDPAISLRRAEVADADAVADVWLTAFDATYDFPPAHSEVEVRDWIRRLLLAETETWLAEDRSGCVVGFMSLGVDMLDQLYILPGWTGQGTGARLVALAKQRRPGGLDLYTFQVNSGARRFYERHGFVAVAFSDGNANEERQPDVRYRWTPDR
jgi:6-phosphogluconolactonase